MHRGPSAQSRLPPKLLILHGSVLAAELGRATSLQMRRDYASTAHALGNVPTVELSRTEGFGSSYLAGIRSSLEVVSYS